MTNLRVILLVVFGAAMLWLWYPFLTQTEQASQQEQETIAQPDYVAIDLKQTSFAENGQLSYQITAQRMELYQELGFSHFEVPIFVLHNGQHNWQLTANEATLYENDTLILEGNVKATNLNDNAMITEINADNLRLEISNRIMRSEQPVIITGPSLTITGKGLTADLNIEVIELINHTETIYDKQ
ncbi:LPS export ABC transporter periplasmic protein LptC [Pseudoalteromonas luteoviolacea]|uniref:LPS export ABC transporter periplasmic protein LptC n=1 Tax=Pseudoalteromonas luteoviolacea TaxID=43657 RepID=UPI001EEF5D1A|nr:LPS export ABC transporter periplasmic protein LptC [Pseudoalteromonas luteoviolacea]MCF6441003.1 LPS export ABC transporter periplasmic protein LptC [Pseudoalteromonas luteoviolacea]